MLMRYCLFVGCPIPVYVLSSQIPFNQLPQPIALESMESPRVVENWLARGGVV